MKPIVSIITITLVALLWVLSSCNKDDSTVYGDIQKPIVTFADDIMYAGANIDFGDRFEMGCSMEFMKPGRISQLCVRIPDHGVYRVTLWDLPSRTVITSVSIECFFGPEYCADISPYYVEEGDRVAVTVYTEDWARYTGSAGGHEILPVEVGDVEILSYGYHTEPTGFEFPDHIALDMVEGLADIVFEPEL
ncbi:MAG: hypothetical protein GY751_06090 [Bacteroidetes bacterium]|nr:hypothetical protein [Bacteroidota bacterium]